MVWPEGMTTIDVPFGPGQPYMATGPFGGLVVASPGLATWTDSGTFLQSTPGTGPAAVVLRDTMIVVSPNGFLTAAGDDTASVLHQIVGWSGRLSAAAPDHEGGAVLVGSSVREDGVDSVLFVLGVDREGVVTSLRSMGVERMIDLQVVSAAVDSSGNLGIVASAQVAPEGGGVGSLEPVFIEVPRTNAPSMTSIRATGMDFFGWRSIAARSGGGFALLYYAHGVGGGNLIIDMDAEGAFEGAHALTVGTTDLDGLVATTIRQCREGLCLAGGFGALVDDDRQNAVVSDGAVTDLIQQGDGTLALLLPSAEGNVAIGVGRPQGDSAFLGSMGDCFTGFVDSSVDLTQVEVTWETTPMTVEDLDIPELSTSSGTVGGEPFTEERVCP